MIDFVVAPSGEIRNVAPRGATYSLDELQELVGGHIELVRQTHEVMVFADEDGRLRGLPPNPVASSLAALDLVGDVLFVAVARVE